MENFPIGGALFMFIIVYILCAISFIPEIFNEKR